VIPVELDRHRRHLLYVLVSSISAIDYFVGFWKKIDRGRR